MVFYLLLSGCGKHEEKIHQVDQELATYLDRFVQEAKIRGVTIPTDNIIMEFTDRVLIDGIDYCGQSISGSTPHVQIVQSDICWKTTTDMNKEILVFHELGHALLGRVHDNSTLSNGLQKTIMISTLLVGLYTKFTPQLRKYYLDELFNPNTLEPSWAKIKTNSTQLLKDSITVTTDWLYHNLFSDLNHTGSVSGIYYSPGHSLSITSPSATGSASEDSYWYKVIPVPSVAEGSELRFNVKIRTDNIVGKAFIGINAVSGNEYSLNTFSQYDIKGTQNFTEYSILVLYCPQNLNSIYIYMALMGNTSGTVYFDDVELLHNF